jgi:MoaD family protein
MTDCLRCDRYNALSTIAACGGFMRGMPFLGFLILRPPVVSDYVWAQRMSSSATSDHMPATFSTSDHGLSSFNTERGAQPIAIMARISVKMFATVREAAGTSECVLEADDLADLVSKMRRNLGPALSRIIDELDSDPEALVILINGLNVERRNRTTVKLRDGDDVAVFPPVSGG